MNVKTAIQLGLYLIAFVCGLITIGLSGQYYLIAKTVSGLAYMMGFGSAALVFMGAAYAMEVI